MEMHLYFDCEDADVVVKNSIADSCGTVRNSIEKVLSNLYRNLRDSSERNKEFPQFLRAVLTDGSGYLRLLMDLIYGFHATPRK